MECQPIGYVEAPEGAPPRHWSVSSTEGRLVLDEAYWSGLEGLAVGQRIIVLFLFHRSPPFAAEHLHPTPPGADTPRGLFSTCAPIRPNPIGMSVLEVTAVGDGWLDVRGLDTYDGTPLLDIKPHVTGAAPD